MSLYGYGKILEVDLSTGQITKREITEEFARRLIGGMGFSCKILYDEVQPGVDPFGPENIIVFAVGPLTGTLAPCSGRTEVSARSPLTTGIGTGNFGGMWGAYLKHAGFDVLIVRGKSSKPVFLWIDDDNVQIKDAGQLWGKDVLTATDSIKQELSPSNHGRVAVVAIGPAGENLVRYACLVGDHHHVAGRCGTGAVMGSKNLKAIAVRGTGSVSIAKPEEFREAARMARERLLTAVNEAKKTGWPPPDSRELWLDSGSLPGKNYQTGVMPNWLATRGRAEADKYIIGKEGTCHACPISCFTVAEVKEGKYAGLKMSRATAPGVVNMWGAKNAIESLPAIWKIKKMCHTYGLDYASTSGSIAFAMELFQRGIITKQDTGGLELTWGNDDAVLVLMDRIAHRQGFGDVLAEGSVRAAARIGKGSERYVMTMKEMELMLPDPRTCSRGWTFGVMTNPRGGDNVKNTHFFADFYNPNWWTDKFDIFEDKKRKMYPTPPEQLYDTWEGKAEMCCWFEDLYSAINDLGMCFFPAGFQLAIGPTYLASMLSACTGWDVSPQDMMKYGERTFHLLKAYTVREGLTRKDDSSWPDRFYDEPMPEGPTRGAVLNRNLIQELLDEYYVLRGWEKERGIPTYRKLKEIGLDDIAEDLANSGKIAR